jgi:hypothetical protein
MRPRPFVVRLLVLAAALGAGLAEAQESRIVSDLRRQGDRLAESCSSFTLKAVASCGVELATGFPLHVAFGNLAPQNGFAFGVAFSERYAPGENWRINWSADGVKALSGSWRAGAYVKIVRTAVETPVVVRGGTAGPSPAANRVREYPVLNLYAQTASLNELHFFGPVGGPEAGTAFRERQGIVGASLRYPLDDVPWLNRLRPSVTGAVNGRFVDVTGRATGGLPATDAVYGEADAPGLASQPSFLQFEESVRLQPAVGGGRVRLNYAFGLQQFLAPSSSRSSFSRWTLDLRHEFPLNRGAASAPASRETNTPNECFTGVGAANCPPVVSSRDRYGAVGVRLLAVRSWTGGANRVPFYFQQTIGGGDIDGQRILPSADDYRYRGPNLVALQETLEHSLWGPVGLLLQADQARVTTRGLGFGSLRTSYAVGVTIRAGGLPFVALSFAWGTGGHHVVAAVDQSLLGGSARPSLK